MSNGFLVQCGVTYALFRAVETPEEKEARRQAKREKKALRRAQGETVSMADSDGRTVDFSEITS